MRLRTIANCVGITERATHKIICELEEAGYLTRHRLGRLNFYEVHPDLPLRHPLEADHSVGELLKVFLHRDQGHTSASFESASSEHGADHDGASAARRHPSPAQPQGRRQ